MRRASSIPTALAVAALLFLGAAPTGHAQAPVTTGPAVEAAPRAPELLRRVVCIGASASGGYGLNLEIKARVKIGLLLDQLLVGERRPSVDLGSSVLFRAPDELGAKQIEDALAAEPTLVVGVDFLFWFAYSTGWSRGARGPRAERLERGLALLDRLECPLLIGDLPDMSLALEGEGPFGGPLVQRNMIPEAQELVALNARIHAWAEERGDTTLVPLREFVRRATAGEVLEVRGNRWDAKEIRELLQKDLLHPTSAGAIGLLIVALDRLVEARDDLAPEHVRWDAAEAEERLLEATAEERARTVEREQRHAERRRRREEAREEDDDDDGERDGGRGRRAPEFLK